jgi:glycosyltransferase involved in cell wall biosynthesis
MEAMAAGLPIICSNIRGNSDLIKDGEGGYLVDSGDVNGFAERIRELVKNTNLMKEMGSRNKENIKRYDLKYVKG